MEKVASEILFDKFEVIKLLKKDECTSVYLADHIYLGKKIILKTLDVDNLSDKSMLERFKREAKILAMLEHPNLIKVLDFGMYKNFFYISFEFFESRNLRDVINKNVLSLNEKMKLIIQLLQSLNFAHQNKIIHRDIKPENILVNIDLHLKVADFGLALIMNENTLTRSTSIVGTPGYMAPEQIRGEKILQSDLFAAGTVAYELLTGKNPFLGENINETLNNILTFNEEKIFADTKNLPENIQQGLRLLLKKNLDDRAKSAFEVLKIIGSEEIIAESVVQSRSIARKKKRSISVLVTLVFAVIALFGLVVFKFGIINNRNTELIPQKNRLENNPAQDISSKLLKNDIKNDVSEPVKKHDIIKPATQLQNNEVKATNVSNTPGALSVECFPWADVYIDGKKVDQTPINSYQLIPGVHKITLENPDFPLYNKNIEVLSNNLSTIKVNFTDLVGYLSCEIFPWGKVFIDGVYKGTTPLQKPIALLPGEYALTIVNPTFKEVTNKIKITAKQTYDFKLNMETVQ